MPITLPQSARASGSDFETSGLQIPGDYPYVKSMTIKWKITALVAILFAVLGVVEMIVAKNVLMPSFTELESKEADIAMRRVQFGMDQTSGSTRTDGRELGELDRRISLRSRSQSHLRRRASNRGRLDAAQHQRVAVQRSRRAHPRVRRHGSAIRERVRFGAYVRARASGNFPWRANWSDGRPAKGLLKTKRGILMVAAAPVLDGYGHGPSRGMVIIGRLLSAAEIEKIGAHAQANVSMVPLRESGNPTVVAQNRRRHAGLSDSQRSIWPTDYDIAG